MTDQLSIAQIKKMLASALEQIRENHKLLTKLDSETGDGDHGTTMLRAMDAVEKALADNAGADLKDLLFNVGWAVMGVDGGSTGPLLGSLFMGMSEGAGGQAELDCPALASMFAAGLNKIREQTKAQVGDKTMMDAMVPAVAAMEEAGRAGKSISRALKDAAVAAEKGALSTKDFPAKYGRAKNLGQRTVGHQDPGAASIALIFKGLAQASI